MSMTTRMPAVTAAPVAKSFETFAPASVAMR